MLMSGLNIAAAPNVMHFDLQEHLWSRVILTFDFALIRADQDGRDGREDQELQDGSIWCPVPQHQPDTKLLPELLG